MPSWKRSVNIRNAAGVVKTALFPEAASQTFKKGDAVRLSASGKLEIVKASSATYGSSLVNNTTPIVGFALAAASGVENTGIPVALFDGTNEFLLPVIHATLTSAVTALTQVGAVYQLAHFDNGGTVAWGVSLDNAATPMVAVQQIDPTNAVGEQYGTVWVKGLASASQLES